MKFLLRWRMLGLALIFFLCLQAKPLFGQAETSPVHYSPAEYAQHLEGIWLERYTVDEDGDTLNEVMHAGQENYWIFAKDGSFQSASKYPGANQKLFYFGAYESVTFDGMRMMWDGQDSGWDILVLTDQYFIKNVFSTDEPKPGQSIWIKVPALPQNSGKE